MAQPTAYNRVTSFSNYQAVNPTTPLPASSLDQELNAIKTTLDELLENIELIQRDDGDLANDSVGLDQLSAEVTVGFNVPEVWVTLTDYTADEDTVFNDAGFYRCLVTHTSGTFATDLAAGKWELIVDLSGIPLQDADQVAVTPAGGLAATDVQTALEELDSEKAATSHTHVATAISDSTSAGRTLLTAADLAAQLTALGLVYAAPSYGDLKATSAITPPTGWVLAYGQAVSRTTYPDAFAAMTISQTGTRTSGSAVITGLSDTSDMAASMPVSGTGVPSSTTILSVDSATQITLSQNATSSGSSTVVVAPHGVGDGTTTFNVPDMRGRVIAGRDNMGGSAASRLTSTYFGTSASRLGATGGSQSHTLIEAELPAITPEGTIAHNATNWTPQSTITLASAEGATTTVQDNSTGTLTSTFTGTEFGGDTPHKNVQPTIVENIIVFLGA